MPENHEEVLVLFDIGSQSSFISTKLANRLRLERKETENLSISSFGNKFPMLHRTTKVDIGVKTVDSEIITINTYVLDYLTDKLKITEEIGKTRIERSRTFENIGLDYFGPLSIKNETGIVKRRGLPGLVLSDNASQFQLVFKTIMEQNTKFTDFLTMKGITWKNTTPRAPWEGGIYERMIGVTKTAMRRAIGRKLLWERELITLIIEIEGVLNTRPLTYVNFEDYVIIRPIDFILPNASLVTQIPYDNDEEEYHLYRLSTKEKLVRYILGNMEKEYLTSLRERTQREHNSPKGAEERYNRDAAWKTAKSTNKRIVPLEINDSLDNQPPISEESIQEVEQEKPIASRTRSATNKRTIAESICKSNWTMSSLVLISTIFILSAQAKTMKECEWKVGIPFNIPQRWNCDEIAEQNFTMNRVIVYTRTHVRIPAIKCSNITRTYSYGWLGVKCQSTTNFIFIKGEIFLYDGKGLLSDFDNVERCTAISGKCVTNNGIVLWDGEEMGKSCPYRKIGEFDAQLSGSHVIIDKLQTSFIFKENGIILNSNCNFSEPYLMNGNIIIDKGTNNLANNIRKQRSDPEGENNLLLLIEWLSTVNPTLAVKLLLQRNDIIAKRIKGKLLIAPCSFNASEWKTVDFKAGIVSKFEIEKINADLDILAQTLGITNPVHGPTREESLRELIVEQGEELVNQLETEFDETTELIEQELSEVMKRWKLITFSIIVFVILIIIIVIKLKFELIRSLCRFSVLEPQIEG
ncbi:Integrase core domain containing protein [Dirofilaria immitis]|nr:Integrase core domain containing protein [Dirofilaria immitis]